MSYAPLAARLCSSGFTLVEVIRRRTFLALPAFSLLACSRRRTSPGFQGYAFIANEDSKSIAAVDLEAMAVARHIPLDGAPISVISAAKRPFAYALAGDTATVHEISLDRLSASNRVQVGANAIGMQMNADESAIFVLTRQPRALVRVDAATLKVGDKIALPDEPVDFAVAPDGKTAAVSFKNGVRLIDLPSRMLRTPAGGGDFGGVRFLADSSMLIAADRGAHRLSMYDVATSQLITHLPLAVRPDQLCFNADGGQLFVTGEGADAVAIIFPYRTPEVAETLLVGHSPGPMAASNAYLFVASPSAGDLSILEIGSRKLVAVVSVGSDPGFIAVTPDDQYALVLNRQSGDVSVLRIATITRNRDRRASLLTVIPVGSRPVSAAVRAV
jgi:DNA-binding beta-propeller fold protein YncE